MTTGYCSIYSISEYHGHKTITIMTSNGESIDLACPGDFDVSSVIISKDLQYGISYQTNELCIGKGTLLSLNTSDVIDNR